MLKNKVNDVLLKLSFLDEIHERQRLKEDLGLDSLSLTELMVALEEAFEIELQMEDLDPAGFTTVADVYAVMGKYTQEGAIVHVG